MDQRLGADELSEGRDLVGGAGEERGAGVEDGALDGAIEGAHRERVHLDLPILLRVKRNVRKLPRVVPGVDATDDELALREGRGGRVVLGRQVECKDLRGHEVLVHHRAWVPFFSVAGCVVVKPPSTSDPVTLQ